MTDKERIEEIIKVKQLTNVEFCSQTCMAPATLSHILSERTKPTLPILRNVVEAFPDLNPMWVLLGQGEMFVAEGTDGGAASGSAQTSSVNPSEEVDDVFGAFRSGLGGVQPPVSQSAQTYSAPSQVHGGQRGGGQPQPRQINVEEVVDLTLRRLQKPQRKVTEVRIYFDDGTYEAFSAR